MKNLTLKSNRFFLPKKKNAIKKNLLVLGSSLILALGSVAQNASYNGNVVPVPGTGSFNSMFGVGTLFSNTTGHDNVAMGYNTLYTNTTGYQNTGLGTYALTYNNTGYNNTANGFAALSSNTSARDNSAFGFRALNGNTTGNENTAVGSTAMYSNSSGVSNTAAGFGAMYKNTTGYESVAFGHNASYSNLVGTQNTALGFRSLYTNTGSHNVGAGFKTLHYNTNGEDNTATGTLALYLNTTGYGNTASGSGAMSSYQAATYCSTFGYYSDLSANSLNNASAFGSAAIVNASNRIWLGDANLSVGNVWSYGTYNTVSDGRFKTKISETDVKGIEFIKLLRPVVYNFEAKKATEYITKNMPEETRKKLMDKNFDEATAIRQSGFIAQEVADAAKKSGYDFNGVHTPNSDSDTYGIAYANFVVPLVKAVQEQQKMIEDQKAEHQKLQQQLADQTQLINELQKKSDAVTGINSLNGSAIGFSMDQNQPNPFTAETVVKFVLPQQIKTANMVVYDLTGKQITMFPLQDRGSSSVTLTAAKLSPGIYIYSIIADGALLDSKRMVVGDKQ